MTFCRSIYVKKVMKLLAFIFEQPSYSKVRIKFSNLQVYWFFYFVGWGKTGPAHSSPPPSIMFGSFNLLFSLSVYVTLSTVAEQF